MAAMKAVMLTASIDNHDETLRWTESVATAARHVQHAIDDLRDMLRDAPHITIQLQQTDDADTAAKPQEGSAVAAPTSPPAARHRAPTGPEAASQLAHWQQDAINLAEMARHPGNVHGWGMLRALEAHDELVKRLQRRDGG